MITSVSLYAKGITELKNKISIKNDFTHINNSDIYTTETYFNSPHDLSTGDLQSNSRSGKCIICHTQINEMETDFLWGKPPSSSSETNNIMLASKTSMKCLGCHDGATATNNLPNGTAGYTNISTDLNSNIFNSMEYLEGGISFQSQDLGNNHPVGMVYDETKDDLNAIVDLKIAKLEVGTNKVTCASCHEPHNMTGETSFLTFANAGSALCLDCHNK